MKVLKFGQSVSQSLIPPKISQPINRLNKTRTTRFKILIQIKWVKIQNPRVFSASQQRSTPMSHNSLCSYSGPLRSTFSPCSITTLTAATPAPSTVTTVTAFLLPCWEEVAQSLHCYKSWTNLLERNWTRWNHRCGWFMNSIHVIPLYNPGPFPRLKNNCGWPAGWLAGKFIVDPLSVT